MRYVWGIAAACILAGAVVYVYADRSWQQACLRSQTTRVVPIGVTVMQSRVGDGRALVGGEIVDTWTGVTSWVDSCP